MVAALSGFLDVLVVCVLAAALAGITGLAAGLWYGLRGHLGRFRHDRRD